MPIDPARLARLAAVRPSAIGRLLLLVRRDFVARVSKRMQSRDVTDIPATFLTLTPYIDTDGTRSSELALRAGMSKQAAGKTVRQCEEAGLLERSADAGDGRASLVRLTERGLELLLETHRAVDEVEREYEQVLGKSGLTALRRSLQRLAYHDGEPPPRRKATAKKRK